MAQILLQDKITGVEGQMVGFDASGNAIPVDTIPGIGSTLINATLLQSGWSQNRQTIKDPKLLADGYAYVISPDDISYGEYASSVIYAEDIATNGSITFVAGDAPSKNLTVNILRLELSKNG